MKHKETLLNLFPKPLVLNENIFLERLNYLESFLKNELEKTGHKRTPTQNVDSTFHLDTNLFEKEEVKFLSDFILSIYEDNILIEIKSKNLDLIMKKLSMFKLRSSVTFEVLNDFKIYLLNENSLKIFQKVKFKKTFSDPRFNNLFHRVYIFWKAKSD